MLLFICWAFNNHICKFSLWLTVGMDPDFKVHVSIQQVKIILQYVSGGLYAVTTGPLQVFLPEANTLLYLRPG